MKNKQNLHIHSTYCDGKDTPEETVIEAIARGFDSIGFSEHSFMKFSSYPYQMTVEAAERYKKEIAALKEKYKGTIDVFCGMELEFYSDVPSDGYDYLIGSVHYLDFDGRILGFDRKLQEALDYVSGNFGGDGLAFAKKYFETVARLPEREKIDIIGHFDLLTKNNEKGGFIDVTSEKYLNYGYEAIAALKGRIPFFEVNTGAISRGYRTSPYPSVSLLKEMKRLGYGALITSDCHDARALSCHYEESSELLRSCGFREIYILESPGKFRPESL